MVTILQKYTFCGTSIKYYTNKILKNSSKTVSQKKKTSFELKYIAITFLMVNIYKLLWYVKH